MNRGETRPPFSGRRDGPICPFAEVDVNFSLDFQPRQESDALPLFCGGRTVRRHPFGAAVYSCGTGIFFCSLRPSV